MRSKQATGVMWAGSGTHLGVGFPITTLGGRDLHSPALSSSKWQTGGEKFILLTIPENGPSLRWRLSGAGLAK